MTRYHGSRVSERVSWRKPVRKTPSAQHIRQRFITCRLIQHSFSINKQFFYKWVKVVSFWRNCGAASVGEWNTKIWFINGVDNVNWPPYRDWKADVSSVSPSSEQIDLKKSRSICSDEGLTLETSAFQSLYGSQFTLFINSVDKPVFFYNFSTDQV